MYRETDITIMQHGPRNMEKHSKWPIMLRMHGSVMPKMILPLLTVAAWSTAVTLFSRYVHDRE
jgi:predicted membrane chloride channel (bestrophin family)